MATPRVITFSMLEKELEFIASRSDGPGGQNVNKVNSKVTVRFDVKQSQVLTDDEKNIISKRLGSRLTREGVLVLTAQESRSQMQNKETVIQKLENVLAKAFEKKKTRKPTKPSKGAVQERINKKKQ
ncbi:MAG: aminoacyl-tRNA hydrolase, partial [Marivirga sp.]|nr:aminoacyl-tRNA hydrolase [Marivirga sp.]